ncbi:hypothetical protein [Pseudonocardia sp. H11422]|uniref:hypothetical protein n=1 Tax=Pseudonocardia sp. H11422 TaxID=2835866 RepID=UPI001BDD9BA0|nr:hypothetical protein [Pseudonocardia sp. H11422]
MSSTDLLSTYLNDHLGGANVGLELARRLQAEAAGPDAEVFGSLADEIEEDRDTLRQLIEKLGGGQHPVKQAVGWVAEKAHRLAVHEKLTGGAELTWLLECETLSLGVEGKLALWLALLEVVPVYPELGEVDLAGLADRARDQRSRLEVARRNAARRAFATPR